VGLTFPPFLEAARPPRIASFVRAPEVEAFGTWATQVGLNREDSRPALDGGIAHMVDSFLRANLAPDRPV